MKLKESGEREMYTKTEQRYLKSILTAERETLNRALENSLKREKVDERHVARLRGKIDKLDKMINKLEV